MGTPEDRPPGADWIAIISRANVADFARSFVASPVLEGSIIDQAIVGVAAIRAFFQATRGMYDRIAFTAEYRLASRTCLEWEGMYRGSLIAGITLLVTDTNGLILGIRLFHRPLDQLVAFAADLHTRLDADRGGVR